MSNDATQVRVAVTGRLLTAPVGTVAPVDVTSAWGSGWLDLGYLSEDGPVMSPKRTFAEIKAWQALDPIRVVVTERNIEWKFKLLQRSAESLQLAYGGGTVDTTGVDPNIVHTYSPPAHDEIDERAFGLEVSDGTIIDRWVLPRGIATDIADVLFKRGEATQFDVTIRALAPAAGGAIWKGVSNDPAWAAG